MRKRIVAVVFADRCLRRKEEVAEPYPFVFLVSSLVFV